METVIRTFWAVDWYLRAVHPQPVSLRIAIGEQSSLQHSIGRKANARYNVSGIESRLLYICKIIFGIAVQLKFTNRYQWIIAVFPYFGKIKGILRMIVSLLFGHYLYKHFPFWKVAFFNIFEKISLMRFPVCTDNFHCFFIG